MPGFDVIDRRLLDRLQAGLPITAQPYRSLGEELGLSEAETMERIACLKASGVIRRIGAIFDSRNMGYYSILCAAQAAPDKIEDLGSAVTALAGVTHNYIRQHDYNLWFTLTAVSPEAAEEQLRSLEKEFGVEILRLPATRIYKTRVAFNMEEISE